MLCENDTVTMRIAREWTCGFVVRNKAGAGGSTGRVLTDVLRTRTRTRTSDNAIML